MNKIISDKDLIIATIKAREARQAKCYSDLQCELIELRSEMKAWSKTFNEILLSNLKAIKEADKRQKEANRLCRKFEKLLYAIEKERIKCDEAKTNPPAS